MSSSDESVLSAESGNESDKELMAAYRAGLLTGKLIDKSKEEKPKKEVIYNSQLLKTKLTSLEESMQLGKSLKMSGINSIVIRFLIRISF